MKRVTVTTTFEVDDEDGRYAHEIAGAMWVQVDENVVEHDENGNEISIDVYNLKQDVYVTQT